VSRSHPGRNLRRASRAECALGELCTKLGYCLPPDENASILGSPPTDADAFVDAVLVAEGRDPDSMTKEEKRPLLEIVHKWDVYDSADQGPHADRPPFPQKG